MSQFTDAEMDQMDRAAEARVQRAAFAAAHPEWTAQDRVPAVVVALARAAKKALGRRFNDEPITGFGALDEHGAA